MFAIFRYDFNSPYAYLAAERISDALPGAEWQPVGFAFILIAQRRVPWSMGDGRPEGMAECERRAAERGLPPIRWPEGWPRESYSLEPLRVALFAGAHGRLREYSMAAFRRLFVDGVALGGDVAYEIAADVGLDPREARAAAGGWAKEQLKQATDAAIAEGVPGVPTVSVGGEHFWGDDRLEDAARHSAGA